jgi:hypothetical protein
MENNFDAGDESLSPKKRKKNYKPYKKDKYALSKILEYENYLNNIEFLNKGEGY